MIKLLAFLLLLNFGGVAHAQLYDSNAPQFIETAFESHGHCQGVPESCAFVGETGGASACGYQSGCSWDQNQKECVGFATVCDTIIQEGQCSAVRGCSWIN